MRANQANNYQPVLGAFNSYRLSIYRLLTSLWIANSRQPMHHSCLEAESLPLPELLSCKLKNDNDALSWSWSCPIVTIFIKLVLIIKNYKLSSCFTLELTAQVSFKSHVIILCRSDYLKSDQSSCSARDWLQCRLCVKAWQRRKNSYFLTAPVFSTVTSKWLISGKIFRAGREIRSFNIFFPLSLPKTFQELRHFFLSFGSNSQRVQKRK